MIHEIKTVDGSHIIDIQIRNEINHMIDKGLDFVYVDGKKVSVIKDFRRDDFRETIIEVET